jgi:energy-coupling factor transport system ATP-binding protein
LETIAFKNVSFSYPGSETKALDNINLSMGDSEFIVLCGKSGCGKSTLLRQMKKNLIPYGRFEGEVTYRGCEITELDKRTSAARIGFVQQNPDNQIVTDKVWHELAFGLESLGYSNEVIRQRVAEMASFFGIQNWFRREISELSGGQKQLLNLASIMVMQPEVLILDEPTSQLDPLAAADFLRAVKRVNLELGTLIIISEHRLEEVFPLADKVILMDKAKVVMYDSTDKVATFLADKENQHDMYYGLPSVMRIYSELLEKDADAFEDKNACPLTIREGRLKMEEFLSSKNFDPEEKGVEKGGFIARIKQSHEMRQESKENSGGDCVIEMEDVWFRYTREGHDILRGENLSIRRGEWFCLMGGNGAGKSTTLKAICGNIKPYKGKIKVDGMDIKKASVKDMFYHRLGMLPQNPQAIFTEINCEEELIEAFYGSDVPEEEQDRRITEMLELLQLDHLRKSNPYDLSGGEQQRLALGKILLLEPTILLLDEPTKGLDPFFKRILADIFLKLKEKGTTILMVSHDIEFCAEYADRCALFFDGMAISTASSQKFFAGNNFYTTAANRVARKWFPGAVTCEEVVDLCASLSV